MFLLEIMKTVAVVIMVVRVTNMYSNYILFAHHSDNTSGGGSNDESISINIHDVI